MFVFFYFLDFLETFFKIGFCIVFADDEGIAESGMWLEEKIEESDVLMDV